MTDYLTAGTEEKKSEQDLKQVTAELIRSVREKSVIPRETNRETEAALPSASYCGRRTALCW
jgi:hypothetical protein